MAKSSRRSTVKKKAEEAPTAIQSVAATEAENGVAGPKRSRAPKAKAASNGARKTSALPVSENGAAPPASGTDATAAAPPASGTDATPPAPAAVQPLVPSEWARQEPSPNKEKRMGLVRLTLDEGVKTTVVGHVYGLDFEIEGAGHQARVFFDYYSKRLKVLDYEATDYRAMISRLHWLARANHFDKIFFKASKDDWQTFLAFGYVLEGILRYYFRGEDAYVLSKFTSSDRITSPHLIEESELIEKIMSGSRDYLPPPLPDGYKMIMARPVHIPKLVNLYRRVFETYPSPLTHPDYILQTMERNVIYRAITNERGDIVSAASAEIDAKHANAELTDCATTNSQRGKALMYHILRRLEDDLREQGIMTAYTLSRARSVGINRVFHRLGYEFSGRLVNNCDIYGHYEDMNIWVRRL